MGRATRKAKLAYLRNDNKASYLASLCALSKQQSPQSQLLIVITLIHLAMTKSKVRSGTCSSAMVPLPLSPGPWSWPLVGSLSEMVLNKPAFRWIHRVMKDMGTDIACFRLGGVHVVPITCPKIAREVLKKQDKNFSSRPLTFASGTISSGYKDAVLSPFGDQWMKMRKVLTSEIICPSRHKWLHDKRADEADNLMRYIYNLTAGGSSSTSGLGANVDVRHVARHYCGNVIRRLVFGQRYFGEPQPDGGPGPMEMEHMDASFALLGFTFAFCVSDYLPCLLGLDLDGHEKIIKEANTKVDRLHNVVIEERWRQWNSGERQDGVQDFLDVLITLANGDGKPLLSIDEVKAQSKVSKILINEKF